MWTNELSNQSIYVYFFFLCKSFANVATFQMADEQRAVPVLEFGEILNCHQRLADSIWCCIGPWETRTGWV
jgi:hypothetical protein